MARLPILVQSNIDLNGLFRTFTGQSRWREAVRPVQKGGEVAGLRVADAIESLPLPGGGTGAQRLTLWTNWVGTLPG
jgi:hypothetical protein